MKDIPGPVWLMQPIPYFGERLNGDWFVETKYDGWRLQILRYKDGRAELWGRRLEKKPNWTNKLRYLISFIEKMIPPATILDAELCAAGGRRWIPSLFAKNRKSEPLVFIFDVIYFKGEFVGTLPLYERKRILQTLVLHGPFRMATYKKLFDLAEELKQALKRGEEGIVIKKADSPYLIGKEAPEATHYWRKIKGTLAV